MPTTLLILTLALSQSITAGNGPMSVVVPVTAQQADPPADLDPLPVSVENLGISFHPPVDAVVDIQRSNVGTIVMVTDPSPRPGWRMTIRHVKPDAEESTPEAQVDALMQQLQRAGQHASLISRDQVDADGVAGHLLYARQRVPDSGEEVITGWLIFPTGDDVLLIVSIYAAPQQFNQAEPLLRKCFETMRVTALSTINERRGERLERGLAFLQSIDAGDLRAAANQPISWYRHYRVTDHGHEEEVGFSTIEIMEGQRGMVTPQREPSRYTSLESQEGLIVKVQARMIGQRHEDPRRATYYDTEAIYWLSWDRETETWSIRSTVRQGDAAASEAETGVRTEPGSQSISPTGSSDDESATVRNPHGTLQVMKSRSNASDPVARKPTEWPLPEAYLSQVERWLLPMLLPRDSMAAGEFGYYFYDSTSGRLTLRVDEWAPAGDGEPGTWRITSRATPDSIEVVAYYDDDGRLIRRERPDGSRMTPIEPDELRQLWRRKGLLVSPQQHRRGR